MHDWQELRNPIFGRAPPSCCQNETRCVLLHEEGCLENLLSYEMRQLDIIGPIGLAFGVFQVNNYIFTCMV